MSLSRYIRDMAENYHITAKPQVTTPMIPNNVLRTAHDEYGGGDPCGEGVC